MQSEVLILGCGVAGLSCGIVLQSRGRRVRIVAAKHWRETPSGKAGGLWLPYRAAPMARVLGWSKRTYDVLVEQSHDPANGVLMRDNYQFHRETIEPEEIGWLSIVPSFRQATKDELPAGYACGFVARVPVMDVPRYMPRLEQRFREGGGEIEITGQPFASIEQALENFPARVVVNCTGLGSRELCGDREMIPVRGQLLRLQNPGVERCVADEHHPLGIAYAIARTDDVVLGGTAEEFDESIEIDPSSRDRLIDANAQLEPKLRNARVIEDVVCIRPGRTSVRLEREDRGNVVVVHNYGHGGAGFTVSWGCAEEVAAIVESSSPSSAHHDGACE